MFPKCEAFYWLPSTKNDNEYLRLVSMKCNLVMVVVQFVGVTNSSFGVFYSFFMNLVFMTHVWS